MEEKILRLFDVSSQYGVCSSSLSVSWPISFDVVSFSLAMIMSTLEFISTDWGFNIALHRYRTHEALESRL